MVHATEGLMTTLRLTSNDKKKETKITFCYYVLFLSEQRQLKKKSRVVKMMVKKKKRLLYNGGHQTSGPKSRVILTIYRASVQKKRVGNSCVCTVLTVRTRCKQAVPIVPIV